MTEEREGIVKHTGFENDEVVLVVIDPDPEMVGRVKSLAGGIGGYRVVAAEDVGDPVPQIREAEPDAVLVDPGCCQGVLSELLGHMGEDHSPLTVVSSRDGALALTAFDGGALDFICKPARDERIFVALKRVRFEVLIRRAARRARSLRSSMATAPGDPANVGQQDDDATSLGGTSAFEGRLLIKERGRLFFVEMDEIRYIESDGNYLQIHVGGTAHLARGTMTEVMERLDRTRFVRIHRSTIVNTQWVTELRPDLKGRYSVKLADGTELVLSRGFRDDVIRRAL